MEESKEALEAPVTTEEKGDKIDLNSVYPGKHYDLNRLFPDEGTKKLLWDLKRNKRDIERFIRNLDMEEE